jgi:hypothetical protein
MTETIEDRTQSGPVPTPAPRGRRSWLIAAGAAAITVLLVGTLLAVTSIGDTKTAAPPTGTDPITVVTSAYDALNAGDVDTWAAHFTDGAVIFGLPRPTAIDLARIQAAANYRAEPVESCRLVDPAGGEAAVECTVIERNDFFGAGGISLTRTERFVVNEDSRIDGATATVVAMTQPGYYVYSQAFWDWMSDAHRDVFDEIRPQIRTHPPADPAHMRTALGYMDEFLAQSDQFPVTDGS